MTERPAKYPDFKERLWGRLGAMDCATTTLAAKLLKEKGGFDPRSLYPWLKGERIPAGDNLQRVATVLKTTAAYLIYGAGPETTGATGAVREVRTAARQERKVKPPEQRRAAP